MPLSPNGANAPLTCRVVASPCMAGVAPALVKAVARVDEAGEGQPAQLTLVFGMDGDDVDWEHVGELILRGKGGPVVLCLRSVDERGEEAAARVGVSGLVSLGPAAQAFDALLGDAITATGLGRPVVRSEEQRFPDLSPKESHVVALIAAGRTNQEIADELFLSMNTIKSYIRTAYRKMGVSRRSQAVAWALRH